jgi:multiple sugar transport system permease protein
MTNTELSVASLPRRVAGTQRQSRLGHFAKRRYFLLLLALPAFVYVVLVGVGPLARGAWYSLFDYNLQHLARTRFVGLDNYVEVFSDQSARLAIYNTFLFTIVGVATQLVLGFCIALLLWRDDRFNRMCLAFLLIPATITPLVVGLIFRGLLGADYGLVGYFIANAGLGPQGGLLSDGRTALWVLILIDCWEWTPLMALILLAGLKALPVDILEAAIADGATANQRFTRVILPLMLPSIFLALILRVMDAFRVFDTPFVTTGGGPGDATETASFYTYLQGLRFFSFGYAAAISYIQLIIITVVATILVRRMRKGLG